jgi:hypothetical protein
MGYSASLHEAGFVRSGAGKRSGVVIGHYNALAFLELNLRLIRQHCGDVPILISDDCSPGFGQTPPRDSVFGRLLSLQSRYPDILVWPNVERIGHAGGDMAAIWKGIVWAKAMGLSFLAKLSQRCMIDRNAWLHSACRVLHESGEPLLGRSCSADGWNVRTEAIVLNVDQWHRPDILAHLTPRRIGWAVEMVLWDDVRDRLGGKMAEWDLLSPSRYLTASDVYFRGANRPSDFERLARRVGLTYTASDFDTRPSDQQQEYLLG